MRLIEAELTSHLGEHNGEASHPALRAEERLATREVQLQAREREVKAAENDCDGQMSSSGSSKARSMPEHSERVSLPRRIGDQPRRIRRLVATTPTHAVQTKVQVQIQSASGVTADEAAGGSTSERRCCSGGSGMRV